MRVRTPHFLSALLLAAASATIATNAQAQDYSVVFRPRESVPEATNRTYYRHSESMTQENDSLRGVQGLLGTFQFPENAILKDGKDIHGLYNFLMERQASDDPIIRTADLNTPFNLSVQTLPTTRASRMNGGEFVFERTPETAAPAATPIQPAAPQPAQPDQPAEPVQAKF